MANRAGVIDLKRTIEIMQSAKLAIDGHDTWNHDKELQRNYILTAARRVQVAANLITQECAPFQSLLEVGLSPGVGLAPVVALNPNTAYAALDSWPSMTVKPCPAQEKHAYYEVDGREISLNYWQANAEMDHFPFEDQTFDVVNCCDVLEHLLFDPYHLVEEANRVLKPGGFFLLETCPSQGYWTHKAKLLLGHTVERPYSGYGPYGRHNRLFLPWEVRELVKGGGFQIRYAETVACYPGAAGDLTRAILAVMKPVGSICDYLGSHIFVLGRKSSRPLGRPMWLYEQWDKYQSESYADLS